MKLTEYVDKSFGRLTVIGVAQRKNYLVCRCECGIFKDIQSNNLRSGATKSCGCLNAEKASMRKTVHGLHGHYLWKTHSRMMARCYKQQDSAYHRYGGRGIYVEESWHSVENFIRDMGDRPKGYSLERVDNDGPYAKENCIWASAKEQAQNRRSTRKVTLNGVERTITEWAAILKMSRNTISRRLNSGMSAADALQSRKRSYV